jgi:molybdopterin synthase sulfur carrier subunit
MRVTVRYFASVKEQLGKDSEELELPAGVATVAGVRAHLKARGGDWQAVLSEKKSIRIAVNQEMAPQTAPVKAGDEIAFFPPVTGG